MTILLLLAAGVAEQTAAAAAARVAIALEQVNLLRVAVLIQ